MTDRLHTALEVLATRGTPRHPDEFAAAVLGEAPSPPPPASRRRALVLAGVAAAVAAALGVAALVAGDGGGDRTRVVTPVAPTTETVPDPPPATTAPPATEPPPTRRCPDVAFTPNSEDMASDIRATGVACDDAEQLVRRVRSTHNFYGGPRSFERDGWACTVRTEEDALPEGHYDCRRGAGRVTWTKT